MADEHLRSTQYQYTANSNLVLTADRSQLPRRDHEPTGESESLYGRITLKDMGSRAQRDLTQFEQYRTMNRELEVKRERKKKATGDRAKGPASSEYSSIVEATEDFEGLRYRPRTKDTRQIYELILSFVSTKLGGQPADIVRSATDEVLEVLKNDNAKDFDKKTDLDSLLEQISSEEFSNLLNLSRKLTDYTAEEAAPAGEEGNIDDELGVAVVFDESDEGEDNDDDDEAAQDQFVVRDVEEDDDDDGDNGMATDADDGAAGVSLGKRSQRDADESDDEGDVGRSSAAFGEGKTAKRPELSVHDVDAFWLQRTMSTYYADAHTAQSKASEAMKALSSSDSARDVENALMDLFDYTNFDLVKLLTHNRDMIVYCTRLARAATDDERAAIKEEMREQGLDKLLRAIDARTDLASEGLGSRSQSTATRSSADDAGRSSALPRPSGTVPMEGVESTAPRTTPQTVLDLDAMAFGQGSHLMTNSTCKLPQGSLKLQRKGFEEVHVPAPKPVPMGDDERVVYVKEMPTWAQRVFESRESPDATPKLLEKLNRVQSKLYSAAFERDENLLLCAPTGAGKTNVAMLTILQAIGQFRNEETDEVDGSAFKIVYIAPMKALVQEMVGNFGNRLAAYGIKVAELTGDQQLTKEQISETTVIVTTPEKWDVITRKGTDRSYTALVRLVIIDEIHLLHDERGPVLENIVARTVRHVEQTGAHVRLVGLSATLPNYEDVATFLRVNPKTGLFYFDNSYRPCPLQQQYIGVTEKKALKRFQVMNDVTYEKVEEQAGKNQVLIFVHSRKETAKTAKMLRDLAIERETIGKFVRHDAASREILADEAETVKDKDLKDVLPYGFAIHHAGMTRADRTLVEDLFGGKHVQVLVSTATLAWGVNLPAHRVIIKGTQIYNAEKGRWVELSPQDVLQMLGRAGRPSFDTNGEGIIITSQNELAYYLSLLNQQLPIESQFMKRLADSLNAEVVLGTVRDRDEAVQWLSYTYLYVRMQRAPALYSVSASELKEDPQLLQRRVDLIHSAATLLDKHGLVRYDKKTGKLQVTELGRIASHYYISHASIATYNEHLRPQLSNIELFRVFSLSDEFKYIPVREEEKMELQKLTERVPIPVKESVEEPTAKINVLLQAYISQLKLDGFALVADMVYVTQSAARILRALFEMCLKRGWADLARRLLDMCKMVEKRQWLSMTPLRQFRAIPMDVLKKIERKELPWERYFDLNPQEFGEHIGVPKFGRTIHKFVHQIPRLDLQAQVLPITRSLIKIDLTITPDFQYDAEKTHGGAESFWILVTDVDDAVILYHDTFVLKQKYATEEHAVSFTVPLYEPLPPNYYVSIISDRWLHSETKLPISFKHLILPEKYPPPTELLDLQPLPVSALHHGEFEQLYAGIRQFNPIQTQVFTQLYQSDDNVFIGAPPGSGKTICAEFAILRLWSVKPRARVVYIAPLQEIADVRAAEWTQRFGDLMGGKNVVQFTGETTADLKLLRAGDVVIATPPQWDLISRQWRKRENVQSVGLFIADELHLLSSEMGPTYEVVCSRMRFISAQRESAGQDKIRIVGLSTSIGNARDMGGWLGCSGNNTFNFHPSVRPVPLEIHIQGYSIPHMASLMLAMARPTYLAINQYAGERPAIVFVPSRKQSKLTAIDILSYAAADGAPDRFLHAGEKDLQPFLDRIQDKTLLETLPSGIAYYHEALSRSDKATIEALFKTGAIQVLVASRDTCWALPLQAHLVVIMGTQYYDGKDHRYVDYPVADVLQIMGRASRQGVDSQGKCVLMCQSVKKDFYKKFLYEPIAVESHLDHYLNDHFNAEIVTRTITNKQEAVDYLTWTYLYRRMTQNPNYYGLQGVSEQHLSDHLSELVESTVNELVQSKCVMCEDETELAHLNLGMIVAHYPLSYITVEMFSVSLTANTKLKGLLEIVASAAEYENTVIRHHEDKLLQRIYDRCPVKFTAAPKFNDPHVKANILLQAHFSRIQLPADLESDQRLVLSKIIPLIQACVDVISSNGWLNPALAVMELSQMCVQAMWDKDSPLKQIPFFTADVIQRFHKKKVESVFEIMELEDEDRQQLLNFSPGQMNQIAAFVNRYPNVELSHEVENEDDIVAGAISILQVQLERETGEEDDEKGDGGGGGDDDVGPVIAPYFPQSKDEGWWLVVGDVKKKLLLGIQRITLRRRLNVKLRFVVPEAGEHALTLFFMCDSYMGCDQEYEFTVTAKPGEEDEEGDESSDESQHGGGDEATAMDED
ncbi:Pre-mRNA-splicing helicase BRR2 [Sorochytrium milnesiophthora]